MARCKICGKWFKPYAPLNSDQHEYGGEVLTSDELCIDCMMAINDTIYTMEKNDEGEEDDEEEEDDDYDENF